jgi:hypothetical protein
MLAEHGEYMKSRFAESEDPHAEEVAETELVLPDHLFSSSRSLDLGDRLVELVFPGRGHTDGDVVVRIPDVDVVLGGDLIEESAKPWIGLDSWPLEWHASLDVVLSLISPDDAGGAGSRRDRSTADVSWRPSATTSRSSGRRCARLAADGVPLERAVAEGEWPWEADDRIAHACRRGYEHLPPAGRALPLV